MKKVLIGVGVLVVALGILLWRVYANLDIIVARFIEDVGSEVTQTPVRVVGVNLDLKNGRAGVSQLSVASPEGFGSPHIFTLDLLSVAIDMGSLGSNPVIIDEILVREANVTYEINRQGTSNLDVLRKNVAGYSASRDSGSPTAAPTQGPDGQDEEIRLIIRKLHFEGGELNASSALRPDKPVKTRLPAFTMSDIGQSSGGATSSRIAQEVLNRLARQAADAARKAGVDRLTDDLGEKAAEKLGDKAGGALKGLLGE